MNSEQLPVLAIVNKDEGKVGLLEDVYFTPIGMFIERELSYEEAEDVSEGFLQPLGRSIAYSWGDFLNYVEKVFPEKWTQLAPVGVETKTLSNWKWVANAIPPSHRRVELTWSHHEVVAGVETEERNKLLSLAVEKQWVCP